MAGHIEELRNRQIPTHGTTHPLYPRGRRTELIPATAAVIGSLLFAVVFTGLHQFSSTLPLFSEQLVTEYPHVVGSTVAEAKQRASASRLELVVLGERPSERYRRGQVVQQSPIPGSQSGADGTLRVTVSQGISVPDVRGLVLGAAQTRLTDLGWKLGQINTGSRPLSDWLQITIQHPVPGTLVDVPGELAVVLGE
ncbi:MAG: PASTA domain-containing protein [Chloroflexota bacterium]